SSDVLVILFFFQAEDGIRDRNVTGVQTCALPIYGYNTGKSFTSKGSTIAPYDNYSLQGRGRCHLNKKGTIGFSARFAQRNSTLVNRWSDEHMLQDEQKDRDVQISGNYDHHFDSGV